MLTILGAPPPPRLGEMPPGISRFGLEPVPVPLLPGADRAPFLLRCFAPAPCFTEACLRLLRCFAPASLQKCVCV